MSLVGSSLWKWLFDKSPSWKSLLQATSIIHSYNIEQLILCLILDSSWKALPENAALSISRSGMSEACVVISMWNVPCSYKYLSTSFPSWPLVPFRQDGKPLGGRP